MTLRLRTAPLAALVLAATTLPALAHLDPAENGSFLAGFTHPLFGLDHVLAMVAVGVWAAMIGGRAKWLVPAAFVGTMCLGFALALAGMTLPFVEPAILASVIVLGLVVAVAAPLSAAAGMALVAAFALFHGHAHGGEIGTAGAFAYGAGFAAATALLHGAGLVLGLALGARGGIGRMAARALGGATACAGLVLAFA